MAWTEFTATAELEFSLDYLRYADAAGQGDRVVLTAWDDELGRIVGALALTRVHEGSFWLSRPAAVLGGAVTEGTGTDHASSWEAAYEDALYPAATVRNLCDARPLVTGPAPDRAAIERALLDAAVDLASDLGLRSVTVLPVSARDDDWRATLASRGFAAATYTADAVIDLRGAGSLADYLASLPKRLRGNARTEISRFGRDGLTVSEASLDQLPVIVGQEAQTWASHGDPIGVDRLWRLRAPLVEHLSGRHRLLVCTDRAGRVAGSAIHLLGRNRYHCFSYGASYPASPGVYPMLTFYEPVRYAIEHGQTELMLGDTTLRAKILRGAAIRPLLAYTLAFDPRGASFYAALSERLSSQVSREIEGASGQP